MDNLYDHPPIYDLAFAFRKYDREVDVMEECIRRFGAGPVRRVLEVACGPAPHLAVLARRGYEYYGLDVNMNMLAFARQRAERAGATATFINADLRDFDVVPPVDFAFVLLGSLYLTETAEALSHLASVNRSLQPGGLYFLDWCVEFRWGDRTKATDTWTVRRDGLRADVTYVTGFKIDRARQVSHDRLTVEVSGDGARRKFRSDEIRRVFFPQEFALLANLSGFEVVGWWNNWNLERPVSTCNYVTRPITLLRKVGA